MALLSHSAFQPPTPSILFLIPPSSRIQWMIRFLLLLYTTFIALPILAVLVPISVIAPARWFTPLPIHPDNLPPKKSFITAIARGILAYYLSASVWAITGSGNAPPENIVLGGRLTRFVKGVAGVLGGKKGEKLILREDVIPPLQDHLRLGVMATKDVVRENIAGYWLENTLRNKSSRSNPSQSYASTSTSGKRTIYLFFSGGGYVTGYPLVHPFIFSLAQTFQPNTNTNTHQGLPDQAVYAPNVHKSLEFKRAFPCPVLDAVAAFAHLRSLGYESKDIVLMGDSAGAGLVWSLVAYLAVLQVEGKRELGMPGGMIIISPWLDLPPTATQLYPDTIDEPQLLNAARCYLGRYALLSHRPNPYTSDLYLYFKWLSRRYTRIKRSVFIITGNRKRISRDDLTDEANELLHPRSATPPSDLVDWLDESYFKKMTSHHPFISPSTKPDSPFVRSVAQLMAKEGTRVLLYVGTAEWVYKPSIRLMNVFEQEGVEVDIQEEVGGYHIEGCLLPPEIYGAGKRLVDGIRKWTRR